MELLTSLCRFFVQRREQKKKLNYLNNTPEGNNPLCTRGIVYLIVKRSVRTFNVADTARAAVSLSKLPKHATRSLSLSLCKRHRDLQPGDTRLLQKWNERFFLFSTPTTRFFLHPLRIRVHYNSSHSIYSIAAATLYRNAFASSCVLLGWLNLSCAQFFVWTQTDEEKNI